MDGFSSDVWREFSLKRPLSLIGAVLLVHPNIWLSYFKWKLTVKVIDEPEHVSRTIQSFFAGVVTGLLTPNMMGNFIGRFYYYEKSKRTAITLLTLLSNYAQFLASLVFGVISIYGIGRILYVSELSWFQSIQEWIVIIIVVWFIISILGYLFAGRIVLYFRKRPGIEMFASILKKKKYFRWNILWLSLARFMTFTFQFSLVLNAFGEELSIHGIFAIWQVYLVTMMIPSLFFGKLGIKESVSIALLGAVGMNELAILSSSLIIWTVNSLSPALIGLVICKSPTTDV